MLRNHFSVAGSSRPAAGIAETDLPCHRPLPFPSQFAETLRLWLRRSRTRKHLTQLEDPELRDIGVSRAQALAESQKPFWRP
ncbi:DUF1127 domain-containing protein [Aliidongia dinghuensis]|uniref:DUF1127 domain-containing protein n=1 Tax=Aliidongia dinghuensis TaxID=1867774 RepID=UPI00166367D4